LLLVSWNIFVFEFVRFYYYTLFCFSIFCCLKNRRNNRFVFFFFKARLPLHWLAGGAWNLQAPVCCSARTLSMAKPSDAAAGQERGRHGQGEAAQHGDVVLCCAPRL
jgi:hypothetical protein